MEKSLTACCLPSDHEDNNIIIYFNLLSCVIETRLSIPKLECVASISEFTYIHTYIQECLKAILVILFWLIVFVFQIS